MTDPPGSLEKPTLLQSLVALSQCHSPKNHRLLWKGEGEGKQQSFLLFILINQSTGEWEISIQFHLGLMGCNPLMTQKAAVATRLWHNPGHCVFIPPPDFKTSVRGMERDLALQVVLWLGCWRSTFGGASLLWLRREQRLLIRCYLPQVLVAAIGGPQSSALGVQWNSSCKQVMQL